MPIVQFSVPDAVYYRLYNLSDKNGLSPNVWAKYLLLGLMEEVTPERIAEAKREYERGKKGSYSDQLARVKPFRYDE